MNRSLVIMTLIASLGAAHLIPNIGYARELHFVKRFCPCTKGEPRSNKKRTKARQRKQKHE